MELSQVTCDLIPLAVLKLKASLSYQSLIYRHMWPHTACGIETLLFQHSGHRFTKSHVTSYRLRYWNKILQSLSISIRRHMWPHTACGIETYILYMGWHLLERSHVTSYRLRYWNDREVVFYIWKLHWSHVTSYRLRYWNWEEIVGEITNFWCHMWPHTACGIETTTTKDQTH